jgi:hypothetical protein
MRPLVDRARLERFLSELARRADEPARLYLVGGATALLHGWRGSTVDIDLRLEPESSPLLRALPELKEALQVNVELATPLDFLPPLPGWAERSRFVRQDGKLAVFEFDFYAQALAKIERGHAQDLEDVGQMLAGRLVEPRRLRELFDAIAPEFHRFPTSDPAAFREDLERALAAAEGKDVASR